MAKRRNAAYRSRARAFGGTRFDEMMQAAIGGGSRRCGHCGLLRPVAALNVADVCSACSGALTRAEQPPPREHRTDLRAGYVYVDASYADGIAGLAIVGALGTHTQRAEAQTSTQAESLAMRWAMKLARDRQLTDLTFCTDCSAVRNMAGQGRKNERWTVELIPRHKNAAADRLAGQARLDASFSVLTAAVPLAA